MEFGRSSLHDAAMTAERTTGFTDINRQHWSLRYLPPWARPYGRLARWDRPIGIWLLMLPCWWSAALGAAPDWGRLIGWMALFALGALAMRGAGCTWNDIVDRKVDAQVERTRSRPLPAGEVTLRNALIWMVLQSAVGAAILFKLNKFAGGVALLSLVLVADLSDDEALHLLAAGRAGARLQLGRAGGLCRGDRHALLGRRRALCRRRRLDPGLRHDLRHAGPARRRHHRRALDRPPLRRRAAALAHACSPCWRCWPGRWRAILRSLGPYYFGFLLAIALHFGWQIALLKPHDQADCLAKFKANAWLGLLLTVAVIAGHASR